jgi:hypothetical protein
MYSAIETGQAAPQVRIRGRHRAARNLPARRAGSTIPAMHRLAIVWMVALVACAQTVADNAVRTCQPLCGCAVSPLPAAQRDCTAECTMNFEMTPLAEPCIECVVEHADRCTTLFDDCRSSCNQTVPLTSYVDAAPPPGIDR